MHARERRNSEIEVELIRSEQCVLFSNPFWGRCSFPNSKGACACFAKIMLLYVIVLFFVGGSSIPPESLFTGLSGLRARSRSIPFAGG